jgi:hypothetical protein
MAIHFLCRFESLDRYRVCFAPVPVEPPSDYRKSFGIVAGNADVALGLQIEISITRGQPDATAIFSAVAARLICVVVVAVMEWWG